MTWTPGGLKILESSIQYPTLPRSCLEESQVSSSPLQHAQRCQWVALMNLGLEVESQYLLQSLDLHFSPGTYVFSPSPSREYLVKESGMRPDIHPGKNEEGRQVLKYQDIKYNIM